MRSPSDKLGPISALNISSNENRISSSDMIMNDKKENNKTRTDDEAEEGNNRKDKYDAYETEEKNQPETKELLNNDNQYHQINM